MAIDWRSVADRVERAVGNAVTGTDLGAKYGRAVADMVWVLRGMSPVELRHFYSTADRMTRFIIRNLDRNLKETSPMSRSRLRPGTLISVIRHPSLPRDRAGVVVSERQGYVVADVGLCETVVLSPRQYRVRQIEAVIQGVPSDITATNEFQQWVQSVDSQYSAQGTVHIQDAGTAATAHLTPEGRGEPEPNEISRYSYPNHAVVAAPKSENWRDDDAFERMIQDKFDEFPPLPHGLQWGTGHYGYRGPTTLNVYITSSPGVQVQRDDVQDLVDELELDVNVGRLQDDLERALEAANQYLIDEFGIDSEIDYPSWTIVPLNFRHLVAQTEARPRAWTLVTPEVAATMRAGDVVVNKATGKEYRAHSARHHWLEAHPIVGGRPQVSADTRIIFHLDPASKSSYDHRNHDPVYYTGRNIDDELYGTAAAAKSERQATEYGYGWDHIHDYEELQARIRDEHPDAELVDNPADKMQQWAVGPRQTPVAWWDARRKHGTIKVYESARREIRTEGAAVQNIDHNEYPKSLRRKSIGELLYARRDAQAAMAAMPDGPKAGYYADEINYISMELARRQKGGKQESAGTLDADDLKRVFGRFLDRLEELGNDREAMFQRHLSKLVGLGPTEILRKMPRGPRGRWADVMEEIRDELRHWGRADESRSPMTEARLNTIMQKAGLQQESDAASVPMNELWVVRAKAPHWEDPDIEVEHEVVVRADTAAEAEHAVAHSDWAIGKEVVFGETESWVDYANRTYDNEDEYYDDYQIIAGLEPGEVYDFANH